MSGMVVGWDDGESRGRAEVRRVALDARFEPRLSGFVYGLLLESFYLISYFCFSECSKNFASKAKMSSGFSLNALTSKPVFGL